AKGEVRGSRSGSPEGGYPYVRVWDAQSGKVLCTLLGERAYCVCAVWSPDGRRILTGTGSENRVQAWDAADGKRLFPFAPEVGVMVQGLVFSPHGRYVLGLRDSQNSFDLAAIVPLWDARTGKLRSLLSRHEGAVTAAAFSPDSRWLVTASMDGTARIW